VVSDVHFIIDAVEPSRILTDLGCCLLHRFSLRGGTIQDIQKYVAIVGQRVFAGN